MLAGPSLHFGLGADIFSEIGQVRDFWIVFMQLESR